MLQHHKVFTEIFQKFINNSQLSATYAEHIYRNFVYLPAHQLENNESTIVLRLPIDAKYCNFHKGAHGGALATIIDCATTLAMLKVNQNKTTSIDLNTQFLNPVKLGENILIRAECLKFGKSICYSECDIFNEQLKRLVTGKHIKAVVPGTFTD